MERTSRFRLIGRAAAFLLALAITGCASRPPVPTVFQPLRYDYLTKLVLSVGSIDIDDTWAPPFNAGQVGSLSPVPPVVALRQMAQDRLVAAGGAGRAVFKIEDASIVQGPSRLQASFAVQLTILAADGNRSGYAEARVVRTSSFDQDSGVPALRAALYDITRATMDDMNVEFEYQIRRSLHDYLQQSGEGSAAPQPVQAQPLGAPGSPPPALPAAGPTPGSVPQSSLPQSSLPQGGPTPLDLAPPPAAAGPQVQAAPGPTPLAPPQPYATPTYPTQMPYVAPSYAAPSYPNPSYPNPSYPAPYSPAPYSPAPYSPASSGPMPLSLTPSGPTQSDEPLGQPADAVRTQPPVVVYPPSGPTPLIAPSPPPPLAQPSGPTPLYTPPPAAAAPVP